MATQVFIVRHAMPSADGITLSERGAEDARKIAELLAPENIHAVISSPSEKAIRTVQQIADHAGIDVMIDKAFDERPIGKSGIDFEAALTKLWEDPSFAFEGGESNVTAQRRAIDALNGVLTQYEGKNVVIGTHANMTVLMLNYFDGKYGLPFWKQLSIPDVFKLTFDGQTLLNISRVWKDGKAPAAEQCGN